MRRIEIVPQAPELTVAPVIVSPEPPWGCPVPLIGSPSPKTVLKLVALKHRLSLDDLLGPRRQKCVVAARHEAVGLVYTHCRYISLPAIGRIFNRDHTTILHTLRKLRKIAKKAPYRRSVIRLKERAPQ
jgi:chromosomal replication initiation ATPase DnaA